MRISDWSSDVCSSDLLEHHQLHLLHGREALATLRARAPPADRATVVADPRVEDLGVGAAAERTVHVWSNSLPLVNVCGSGAIPHSGTPTRAPVRSPPAVPRPAEPIPLLVYTEPYTCALCHQS